MRTPRRRTTSTTPVCTSASRPSRASGFADDHTPPLRVSGIQSGNFSGPVGSTIGQQTFREGLTVREEQKTFWGWTPDHGYLEMRAKGVVTPRSMVAWWMVGLEDVPERCAEICVTEIFGDAVVPGQYHRRGHGPAGVPRPGRDPGLRGGAAPDRPRRLPHLCRRLDGRAGRPSSSTASRSAAARGHRRIPMQMMIAVFDFPEQSTGDDDDRRLADPYWRPWTSPLLAGGCATSTSPPPRRIRSGGRRHPAGGAGREPEPVRLGGGRAHDPGSRRPGRSDRSGEVVRTHVLRPTWHYVARADIDWLLALTSPRINPTIDAQLRGRADRPRARPAHRGRAGLPHRDPRPHP